MLLMKARVECSHDNAMMSHNFAIQVDRKLDRLFIVMYDCTCCIVIKVSWKIYLYNFRTSNLYLLDSHRGL